MVHVPVPKRFYPGVIRFLADAMRSEGSSQDTHVPDVSERTVEENYRGWTRNDVKLLKQKTHNPTVLAIFDLAAETGGEPVSIRELEQFTGRTFGQVRGDLAGLGRLTRKEFGVETWPFSPRAAADGAAEYWVPGDVLRWWQEA
jgi:hypothetical protein